ncbi:ROK family protein [Kitasatospora sp. NBC_01287]|uniref:ROK family protein n=1 Tax=Kitasatospora sp. NBC_01287 TaxID=2903573 RepID=UPI0022595C76|nr:ROK family protein [Kitasatospora sp. NBC_01287]MCX4750682.1 ROK family protein [Kitasatospora sp. NBC_01287]
MMAGQALVAAVDIGGTKIAGALVGAVDGELRHRIERPTRARESGKAVRDSLAEVVEALAGSPEWSRVELVGVGSAGPVDTVRGTVSPVNIPGWRDFPVVEEVRELAGHRPVVLTGDGVAMTAAEHWRGAARGFDNALCMVVSTGVGGGLVLGGTLRPGPTGNAGHIGHISVDLDGEPCACGGRGCLESLASGTAIARHALAAGWRPAERADAAAVAVAARAGDPAALAAFARAGQALAAGIAAAATLVELEVVVIGGGVAQAGELLFGPLRERLGDYATLSYVRGLRLRQAALATDAGLVGAAAAALWSTGA